MDKDFFSITTTKTVETVLNEVGLDTMNIDTIYQREVVWDDEKQGKFINSVILGIVPNPLIFNSLPGKMNCIDGKQRITSLKRFKNNEIFVTVDNKKYFYDKIPDDYKDDVSTLSEEYRYKNFNKRQIPIIEYDRLKYTDEIDIFTRIQNGMVLTDAEKLSASIDREDIAQRINKLYSDNAKIFIKFNKLNNRNAYRIFITDSMYIINNGKLLLPSPAKRKKFLNSFTTVGDFEKDFNNIIKVLKFLFSKIMLSHKSINQDKINKSSLFVMIFLIYDDMMKYEFDKNTKIEMRKLFHRFALGFKIKHGSKSSQNILDNAYRQLEKKYNNLFDNEGEEEDE